MTVNGDVVSHLNISSIHTNDGGLYKCIASSKVGSAEHAAKLNVYGLPFIRPMEKKAIVAGEMLIVTCPVAGYPIDTIVWERGLWRFILCIHLFQNILSPCLLSKNLNICIKLYHDIY